MTVKKIRTPLSDAMVDDLMAGDIVLLSGIIYKARDSAHGRMVELISQDKELPFDVHGNIIYYVGPAPTPPGKVCGSAGPTTSSRMDANTPSLLDLGLKGMIGKGLRSKEVIQSMLKNKCVYFSATGGAAALISKSIKSIQVIAFKDLGTEAIHKMKIVDFPVIVTIDSQGNNLYEIGQKKYHSLK